ncbi:hypothetical protein JDV02_004564 [Purpureocillium takamizusanense]|uniref:Transmembrane protein n=1 Tax=Purpureocillium takamizusanense TaxID=2060973 RepID=A0A9Q8VAZ4_9HYPO|nr:uncharacterized protein JDV02_004564 [Purpureocillium takamizusanense]UNI18287.1 hypothetical protein JDV02_004564 [Purpureocillium takamizusanense]
MPCHSFLPSACVPTHLGGCTASAKRLVSHSEVLFWSTSRALGHLVSLKGCLRLFLSRLKNRSHWRFCSFSNHHGEMYTYTNDMFPVEWLQGSLKSSLDWLQSSCKSFLDWLSEPHVLAIVMAWAITFTAVCALLLCLGFGPIGIVAGTLAAAFQSYMYGGFTPAGGIFATLTSMAMLGTLMPAAAILAALLATIVAVVVWACGVGR